MALCGGKVDCTKPQKSLTIDVNPDIVGPGIVTAFLVTSLAALSVLVFGYLRDSLPGNYLGWADWAFLQNWGLCKVCRRRFVGKFDGSVAMFKGKCAHTNATINANRRRGLNAFVLSLSDQQLVIGPAMIIAALAQHCSISGYEFQIVASLAYVASNTHLATLIVIRQYLIQNKVVRNIRAVGMILNLGLLIYTLIIGSVSYALDNSASIQCVMSNLPRFASEYKDLWNLVLTIFFVVVAYATTLIPLYDFDVSLTRYWLQRSCAQPKKEAGLTKDEFEIWYEKKIRTSKLKPGSSARSVYLWSIAEGSTRGLYRHGNIFNAVFWDFLDSFLFQVPPVLGNFAYGLTSVTTSRLEPPKLKESQDSVDFGQIVPLFLLLLPVLAGVESYLEVHLDEGGFDKGSLRNIRPALRNMRLKHSAKRQAQTRVVLGTTTESTFLNERSIDSDANIHPVTVPRKISANLSVPISDNEAASQAESLSEVLIPPATTSNQHFEPRTSHLSIQSATESLNSTSNLIPTAPTTGALGPQLSNENSPSAPTTTTPRLSPIYPRYNWRSSRIYLSDLFIFVFSVTVVGGFGLSYNLLLVIPWGIWLLIYTVAFTSTYIRYVIASKRETDLLIESLQGTDLAERERRFNEALGLKTEAIYDSPEEEIEMENLSAGGDFRMSGGNGEGNEDEIQAQAVVHTGREEPVRRRSGWEASEEDERLDYSDRRQDTESGRYL